jgi:hypothetical protein
VALPRHLGQLLQALQAEADRQGCEEAEQTAETFERFHRAVPNIHPQRKGERSDSPDLKGRGARLMELAGRNEDI